MRGRSSDGLACRLRIPGDELAARFVIWRDAQVRTGGREEWGDKEQADPDRAEILPTTPRPGAPGSGARRAVDPASIVWVPAGRPGVLSGAPPQPSSSTMGVTKRLSSFKVLCTGRDNSCSREKGVGEGSSLVGRVAKVG